MIEWIALEHDSGRRLDNYLLSQLPGCSRGNLFRILRKKGVRINKAVAKPADILKARDRIQLFISDESYQKWKAQRGTASKGDLAGLEIIEETDAFLIVNKPKGLLTHPDKKEYQNTLLAKVHRYLKEAGKSTSGVAPVHRLDKNTSGLILFGKHAEACAEYSAWMNDGSIRKSYCCIVHGPIKKAGEVKGFLRWDDHQKKAQVTSHPTHPSSFFVHTSYRPIKMKKEYTLLDVELHTGKTHQIRASLSILGHPIIGDLKYGGQRVKGVTTQMLHAYKLVMPEKEYVIACGQIESFWKTLTA